MLGPSSGDKVATLLEHGRIDGRPSLVAGTMLGDGPGDSRRDAGEVYFLRWQSGER
jgi:hypothetical protein